LEKKPGTKVPGFLFAGKTGPEAAPTSQPCGCCWHQAVIVTMAGISSRFRMHPIFRSIDAVPPFLLPQPRTDCAEQHDAPPHHMWRFQLCSGLAVASVVEILDNSPMLNWLECPA